MDLEQFQNKKISSKIGGVSQLYKMCLTCTQLWVWFSSPSQPQILNAGINNKMANFKLSFFKILGRKMLNIFKIRSGGLKKPASGEGCWEKSLYSH